jgi:transposase
MPRPIHADLRQRMIAWLLEGRHPDDVARDAGCCRKTVDRIWTIWNTFNALFPPYARSRGRPRQLEQDDLSFIIDCLDANPALTLDELQTRIFYTLDKYITLAMLDRTLSRLGETRKLMQKIAAERDEDLRLLYRIHTGREYGYDSTKYIFIDESSIDIGIGRRRFARAPAGERASRSEVFNHHGRRYSLLPALSSTGIVAVRMYEGSVTAEDFVRFIREELVRGLIDSLFSPTNFRLGTIHSSLS